MRSLLLLLSGLLLSSGAVAQLVILNDGFEGGVPSPGWTWKGNTPVFAAGYASQWCITKESGDLCDPPLQDPWSLPFLFHPLPYMQDLYYQVNAMARVDQADGTTKAEIGLGWLDSLGGYSFFYGAQTSNLQWTALQWGPTLITPGFNGAQFGIALHLDPASVDAHGFFDNVKVTLLRTPNVGLEELAEGAFSMAPNPALDEVRLTFPADERPKLVELLDPAGRQVLSVPAPPATGCAIPLAGLSPGVYLVRTTTARGVFQQRLLKS